MELLAVWREPAAAEGRRPVDTKQRELSSVPSPSSGVSVN